MRACMRVCVCVFVCLFVCVSGKGNILALERGQVITNTCTLLGNKKQYCLAQAPIKKPIIFKLRERMKGMCSDTWTAADSDKRPRSPYASVASYP